MRDPYDVLGVSKKAGEAEIKKAFRTLAKKHHPDTHAGDTGAKKRFQEISAAYDIVGDKAKRAKFDAGEIDAAGNARGFDPRQGGGFGGGNPFGGGQSGREFHFTWDDAQRSPGGFQGGGLNAEDILAGLMGGGLGGGGRGRRARPGRGEDQAVAITVSFEEAARGGTRRLALPDGGQIDVKIPAGLKDGQQIRLKGRGGPGQAGGPPGDLLIQTSVAAHPYLTRDGNDLKMDLPVSLQEAVAGGKVPVPTLTGTVSLNIPPDSNSGAVLRLKGKGITGTGAPGDLYVRLIVTLPEQPDAELRRFVDSWKSAYDPRVKMR